MTAFYHVTQLPLFGSSKVCTSCHIEKPLDEFYKQSPSRGGYQAWCIVCWKERRKQKQLQNIQNFAIQEKPISKVCIRCCVEKPIDEFYVDTNSKSGYRGACKDCVDSRDRRRKQPGIRRNKPVVPEGYKWCYGCESAQPLSNFLKDKSSYDGYRTKCNDCCRKRERAYWQNNRERLIADSRERYARKHKRVKKSKYPYPVEPSGFNLKQYRYSYYMNNRERLLAQKSVYGKANRLRYREIKLRRNARKKGTATSKVDFAFILRRDGHVCHICGQGIDTSIMRGPRRLHFDHVIPLTRGGTHSEENLKPAHERCNIRKSNLLISELTDWHRRGPDI